jgi:virginiamycin A acetyltransferase
MLKATIRKIDVFIKKVSKAKKILEYHKRGIKIDFNSQIDNLSIGYGTKINGPAFIASRKDAPVTIGKYCAIAFNLRIRTRNHFTGYANLQDIFQLRHKFPSLDSVKGAIVIGNNVWIADNVVILSGVKVGDGAVLGAGAIVTKDVPPYCIAAGNPARVIKKRFDETIIQQLIQVQWWDWTEDKIKRNQEFFSTDFTNQKDLDLNKLIVE